MSDDYGAIEAHTGPPSQDPEPAPQEPGFLGRIYNAIVGKKPVNTEAPLRKSSQIPRLVDTDDAPFEMTPREPKIMTFSEFKIANGYPDEELSDEDDDALALKYVQESRARMPARPPIEPETESEPDSEYASEPDTEDESEADTEDLDEEPKAMAGGGGGSMVLGNAALAALIVAMSVFQG